MTINEIKRENQNIHLEVILCSRDFDKYFAYCEDCGEIVLKEKAIEIDGVYYCSSCVISCGECGCLFPRRNMRTAEDSEHVYCCRCFEDDCYVCADCGRHYRYSDSVTAIDGCYYCEHCVEEHRSPIGCYHDFKQYGEIKFHGTEKRSEVPFMGLELENDTDCQIDRTAVISRFKNDFGDFLHYEEDGSLSNFGWETITQPASISYHLGMMEKYENMFEILKEEGLRSHDIGSCGLHLHIDKTYFGNSLDSSTAKLLYVFEKFYNELLIFSRRTESQADDWARSRKHISSSKGWIKKTIKDSKNYQDHSMRYFAVNLTNSETIEIRLWRGTLNIETFEATLKFTARLAELCKTMSAVELSKMTFEDLLGDEPTIQSYWNRVKTRAANRQEEF